MAGHVDHCGLRLLALDLQPDEEVDWLPELSGCSKESLPATDLDFDESKRLSIKWEEPRTFTVNKRLIGCRNYPGGSKE